jgi:hypothetical protein
MIMQELTEIALEKAATVTFTRLEVASWLGGSAARQHGLLNRALRAGEVVHIHRNLYCLAPKYLNRKIDPLALAQRMYGPSYISLETALSYHDWIPEAVHAITSVSSARSREYDTPLGRFSFTHVPQQTLYVQVARVQKESGESFLLAEPIKALADYVYVHRCRWDSAQPVVQSLRVDRAMLSNVDPSALEELQSNYRSRRVRRFLKGLGKDLTP